MHCVSNFFKEEEAKERQERGRSLLIDALVSNFLKIGEKTREREERRLLIDASVNNFQSIH